MSRMNSLSYLAHSSILRILSTNISMKRMITGIKPTGTFPHIGNLMGAMLPLRENAKKYDTAIFIPDLHSLTSIRDGKVLNENIRNVIISYLAVLGRDTEVTIFRQSDIVGLTKLEWILNCFTPYSLMLRAHSFKSFYQKISARSHENSSYQAMIDNASEILLSRSGGMTLAQHKRELKRLNQELEEMTRKFNEDLNM